MAKANPQQKRMYDTMVLQAMRLLYKPEQAKMIKQMAGQGDPAEAIASVTAMILKNIKDAAKPAGHDLDLRFIGPAGKEIIGHIIEMLVAFKVIQQEQAQQVVRQAVQMFEGIIKGGGQPDQAPQQRQPMAQPQQQGGLLAQGV